MSDRLPPLANATSEDLANAVMGNIYSLLTAGDDALFHQRRHFFTWISPSWPFDPDEWDFMVTTAGQGETPEERASDNRRRMDGARNFAFMTDFVPDLSGLLGETKQTAVFDTRLGTLSGQLLAVLQKIEVANIPPSEEALEKIELVRNALYEEREVVDTDTLERVTMPGPSPMMHAYTAFESKYLAALQVYEKARADALAGSGGSFETTGRVLQMQLESARRDWEAAGRRKQVEELRAHLARLTGDSMAIQWQKLVDMFENSGFAFVGGGDWFWAQVAPASAVQAANWTEFTFDQSSYESYRDVRVLDARGSASVRVPGLFMSRIAANGSLEEKRTYDSVNTERFSLSFEIAELPIIRPWFNLAMDFFQSRRWRLPDDEMPLSSGPESGDPEGSLVAYPAYIVVVKNLELRMSEFQQSSTDFDRDIKAGGSMKPFIGFGPLRLGGTYRRTNERREREVEYDGQSITALSPQIVGFRCIMLPKMPDPDPNVAQWIGPGTISGGD